MKNPISWLHRHATATLAGSLAALLTVGLVVFALRGHPIELPFAEQDGFIDLAATLLRGSLPADSFRPLLYPIVVASVGALTGGDCFLAGRLVSVLAAGGIILATYFLGRAVADRVTGILAALLIGTNPVLWINGVQANTDTAFVLVFTLTLLTAVAAVRRPTTRAAVLCGLALALSYTTRYTALALVFVAVPAVWIGAPRGQRWRRLRAFGLALAVGLVPHCALTWRVFGRPFFDESWRSLAFRHFGQGNWGYLNDNPFDGTLSVLMHDPLAILKNTAYSLRDCFTGELWNLLGSGSLGVAMAPLLVLGLLQGWQRRPRAALVLGMALAGYVTLICITFFPWERLLLPVLPVLTVIVSWSAVHLTSMPFRRARRRTTRYFVSLGAALALAALLAAQLPGRLAQFVEQHPHREIAAARELVQQAGPDLVLLTTYWALPRHVPCACLLPSSGDTAPDLYNGVAVQLLDQAADYLVVGRATCFDQTFADLARTAPPRHLHLLREDAEVRIYRVAMPDLDALAVGPLAVTDHGDGSFGLQVELRTDAPPRVRVGATLRGPDGTVLRVGLTTVRRHTRRTEVSLVGRAPGRWRVLPRALHPDGSLYAGPELTLMVPGH